MLRSGEWSASDLTTQTLARIQRLDGYLHAFSEVYADQAMRAARVADQRLRAGERLGALHGIPVALKDNVDFAGRRTRAGSSLLSGECATRHAWITQRLLECGAIIVGKTHMVELALGSWGTNDVMGTPRNPWSDSEHLSPGGSSSGSAVAVAAGMVPLAIGTDTGGSVRVPAAFCGVTGFKPTVGRISTAGIVPLSTTLDTVGLLVPAAEDAAVAFAALIGDDTCTLDSIEALSLAGVRIGYLSDDHLAGVQPEILAAYCQIMAKFREDGAHLRPLEIRGNLDDQAEIVNTIIVTEALASWGHLASDELAPMDPAVRARMLAGRSISGAEYVRVLRARDELKTFFKRDFGDLDVFVTPTTQWTAQRVARLNHARPPARYSRIANLLDLCSISVQAGFDQNGLPIGMQIASRSHCDARVLGVARALQARTRWHERRWFANDGK
ncbi:amidase [Variovorax sp. E3]|uniref:amidase n=1 Tax=Variovorax sp. E3 TaxID=1914993 RepID=UPI0018DAFFDD|nr:amidase [Variovorax sp. E3]